MVAYTMAELLELSGLASRTIRKYMQLGLIEKSAYRGVRTTYDHEQLVGILAIKRMTLEGLSIREIKSTLREMSREELLEYTQQMVAALAHRDEAAAMPRVVEMPPVASAPEPAPPLLEPVVEAVAPPLPTPAPTETPPPTPVDARWTRTVLLPGMELLVKEDARPIVKTIAEEIRAKYGIG